MFLCMFSSCRVMKESTLLSEIILSGVILDERIRPSSVRQRLKATYTCPGANEDPASTITLSKVSPCDLCMVIAHASFSGSWEYRPLIVVSIVLVSSFTTYDLFSHVWGSTIISFVSLSHLTITPAGWKPLICPVFPL